METEENTQVEGSIISKLAEVTKAANSLTEERRSIIEEGLSEITTQYQEGALSAEEAMEEIEEVRKIIEAFSDQPSVERATE